MSATNRRMRGGALGALSLLLGGCAVGPIATARTEQPIAIESVRLTAAGHYVDVRYRVLDPAAAQAALGPGVKPVLTDEASGRAMAVPSTAKLGALRQTQNAQRPGHVYFVLFINSAGIRAGSRVSVTLGDIRFRNLTVE